MIVILCALFPEAAPLIQKLCLARDTARTPFPRFWNQGISLYLSGPGEIAAAACTGFALGREETLSSLHLVNFGSAAGPENRAGELFLADALLETGTGRRFYPDLVLDAKIPEAAVRTCQKPADRDTVAGANDGAVRPVLFDMEAAAICEAAMHFLGPDRIHSFPLGGTPCGCPLVSFPDPESPKGGEKECARCGRRGAGKALLPLLLLRGNEGEALRFASLVRPLREGL